MKSIFIFCLSCLYLVLSAQKYKIIHDGDLTSNWFYSSKSSEYNYIVFLTEPDNISNLSQDELQKQDRDAQIFINYMQFGGISVNAFNSNYNNFITIYVQENEYSEWLENNRNQALSAPDYFRSKYSNELPEKI